MIHVVGVVSVVCSSQCKNHIFEEEEMRDSALFRKTTPFTNVDILRHCQICMSTILKYLHNSYLHMSIVTDYIAVINLLKISCHREYDIEPTSSYRLNKLCQIVSSHRESLYAQTIAAMFSYEWRRIEKKQEGPNDQFVLFF
jgi:hypothetical protein